MIFSYGKLHVVGERKMIKTGKLLLNKFKNDMGCWKVYSVAHAAGNKKMYRLRAWVFRHGWMPQNVACLQDLSETHLLCFRWQLCGVSVVCLFFGSSRLRVPLVHASERYRVEHVRKKGRLRFFFCFYNQSRNLLPSSLSRINFLWKVWKKKKTFHSPEDTARRFKIIL